MIIIIKNEDGQERLINSDRIIYSFKRDVGYGLVMEDRSEIWLTLREFEELKSKISG